MQIFTEALFHTFLVACYFGVIALLTLLVHYGFKVGGEIYRKILHLSFMLSVFPFLFIFKYWYTALIAIGFFLILAVVGLSLLERFSFYKDLLAERDERGEVKRSLFLSFSVMALGVYLFWGVQGESLKYIIYGSFLAWGIGDALAALIGKQEKSQVINNKIIKTNKTNEGTLAMFLSSALIFFVVTFFNVEVHFMYLIVASLISGLLGAIVEVISKKGWDTLTLPLLFMALLYGVHLLAPYLA